MNKTSRLAKIADVELKLRYTLKKDSDLMNRVQFIPLLTADCYAAHTQRKVGDPRTYYAELLSDTKTWNGFTVFNDQNIASYIYDFGNRPFWYTAVDDPGTVVFPNRMLQVLSSPVYTPSAFEEIDVQGVPYYEFRFAISTDRKTYGVSNVTTFIEISFVAKELAVISSQVEIVGIFVVDQGTATITKGGCYIYIPVEVVVSAIETARRDATKIHADFLDWICGGVVISVPSKV
ncbi:hypothetical protein SPFM6_00024 [Salmonella phage SPFM6]|nr:hypothetical protein SPFM6_00024 [Salmonella phage SPFM6]